MATFSQNENLGIEGHFDKAVSNYYQYPNVAEDEFKKALSLIDEHLLASPNDTTYLLKKALALDKLAYILRKKNRL